jgi:predicted nucleic acid-binding protein
MDAIADTSFLVGLWRRQAWAIRYAAANPDVSLGLPWIVLGEFWHGAMRAGHPVEVVREFLTIGLPIVDATTAIPAYARICASLQGGPIYRSIGQNDLWIAAVALTENRPLISRNRRHFGGIPDLRCEVLEVE